MNTEYIQNLRYKLQKRVRRLNSLGFQTFHVGLKQFWGFLDRQPILQGILEDLVARQPNATVDAERVCSGKAAMVCHDELENAAFSYCILRHCAKSEADDCEIGIAGQYEPAGARKYDEYLEFFRESFLEPFYEYLDEHLDDQRAVLALLRRYKHKCEWFARERVYALWNADTQKGELNLAQHLYEYLHDQGIDLHIEAYAASGKADLIAMQKTDDPLIADAKIFDPGRSKGKSYIASGFAQVYRYTVDFNEPVGYLVIYQTSDRDVRFALKQKALSTPFVVHNNKTIFLITIDIFPHSESASKRGALAPVEITEEDLVKVADEPVEVPTVAAPTASTSAT